MATFRDLLNTTKAEIRELSRERGLPTWDKPAMACLSSRIPYGTPVTVEAYPITRPRALLDAVPIPRRRPCSHWRPAPPAARP